eukprot:CAMPEP_0170600592 /NCGR_PEP_ID=MMETSP0224-20130122/17415_1 /TAXON_ID=285029 /ORGANISM="Togula jolla, Strain CCCM 725" /LENGTH=674 /DNA_ID=CAMNT_0010925325 /DNA_START=30 /DNA_END=2055 /DNA_ORIENTATION=+
MGLGNRRGPAKLRRRVAAWTSAALTCGGICLAVAILVRDRLAEDVGHFDPELSMMTFASGAVEIPERPVPERRRRLGPYPKDPFLSVPEGKDEDYHEATNKWVIIIHLVLIGYMLLGLNTVCDVYFTGSLDVMVDKWQIKPDVAGATFMAAGGSAPELFTSLIGATLTENDVGFATIVGSAVFNVLFVIGLCGFAASEPITLTWWPLFRDCIFYSLGLALLVICASDGKIVLYEAIILFLAYILYCIIMYNNSKLEAFTDTEFRRAKRMMMMQADTGSAPEPITIRAPVEALPIKGKQVAPMPDEDDDLPAAPMVASTSQNHMMVPVQSRASQRHGSNKYHGKVHAMHFVGIHEAQRHKERMDSLIRNAEVANPNIVATVWAEHGGRGSGTDGSTGSIENDIGMAKAASKASSLGRSGDSGRSQPKSDEKAAEEEEEDECLLAMPEGRYDKVVYFMSLPVYVPLYYSIPTPSERWFLASFVISLLWIAGFAFFLVMWVEIVGEVVGIPSTIMGFTLLAAGTSIPDAVSSVAVARQGEGDMAVSSSIGSNIFDILVGLPIPWIIKIGIIDNVKATPGEHRIDILSSYLAFFVLLLLFMVLCVVEASTSSDGSSTRFLAWQWEAFMASSWRALWRWSGPTAAHGLPFSWRRREYILLLGNLVTSRRVFWDMLYDLV